MDKIRKLSATALLFLAINGTTQEFLPTLFNSDASAHETVVLTFQEEKERIEELKGRLKAEGYTTIDSVFQDLNFRLERNIVSKFVVNPEKEVASGKRDYEWYRKFLEIDKKISIAPFFAEKHMAELVAAERRYGVDKRFIVGVLGIESNFGNPKNMGKYKAFNALVTLYVLTGKRDFAFRELRELIRYASRTRIPIFAFNSSYAGAIGCGQFIPSSLNAYFIGKNGIIESSNPMDIVDCIYSIPYYLLRSGWDKSQNGKPTTKNSRNWKALFSYNRAEPYVMAIVEVATALK